MTDLPGYTHLRELGAGASGRVVHAVHDATRTQVAIKYVSPELLATPGFRVRFREEARLLATLTDPNVVTFYDYVESERDAAIVMELVDGVTLRRVLDSGGAMDPEVALVLLKGSLRGLAAAHAAGVVHRDYKPANVLVRTDGTSKLSDFGIATRAGAAAPSEGSPAYLAPEQWAGAPVSPRADVYAATVVCFECVTGHRLFAQQNLTELARAHREAPVPLDDVPEPVRELISHGLAKDPAARPASAAAFLSELESAARAGYGDDWEDRGRRKLAGLVLMFASLLPSSLTPGSLFHPPGGPVTPPKPSVPKPGVPKSILISGGAVITAAVVVGAVVVVGGSGDESPPANPTTSAVALPQTPPKKPDEVEVIVVEQVGDATGSFTYELNGCCENQFHGEGRVGQRKAGSAAEITEYYNIPDMEQGRDDDMQRGIVLDDVTYLGQGRGYREFPTGELTGEPRAGMEDAEIAARGLVTVREAVGLDRIVELLDTATKLEVRESGDTITYAGTVPPDPDAAPDDPNNPFRELGTDFELELDAKYRPVALHEVYNYSLIEGDHSKQLTDVTYSGWGDGKPIEAPR